jgi:hypothetical protein
MRELGGEASLLDQPRGGPARVGRVRSHALDDDRASETFHATDGAQKHLGLSTYSDLVSDLVALGTRCFEGTSN